MKKSEVERLFRVLKEGLVCVLKSVEPCVSFGVSGNRDTGKLEVVIREYKCLFLYFYYQHKEFGFVHVRLQTWFPFVMFKDRQSLTEIYPELVEHALVNFNASDLMTFLGRKLTENFQGDITTDTKKRPQGVLIKHRMFRMDRIGIPGSSVGNRCSAAGYYFCF